MVGERKIKERWEFFFFEGGGGIGNKKKENEEGKRKRNLWKNMKTRLKEKWRRLKNKVKKFNVMRQINHIDGEVLKREV